MMSPKNETTERINKYVIDQGSNTCTAMCGFSRTKSGCFISN